FASTNELHAPSVHVSAQAPSPIGWERAGVRVSQAICVAVLECSAHPLRPARHAASGCRILPNPVASIERGHAVRTRAVPSPNYQPPPSPQDPLQSSDRLLVAKSLLRI